MEASETVDRGPPHCNDNDIAGGNLSSPPAKRTAYACTSNADRPSVLSKQVPNAVSPQDTTISVQEQLQVPNTIDQLVLSSGGTKKSHGDDIVPNEEIYSPDRTSTSSITGSTVSTTYSRDQQNRRNRDNDSSVKSVKETDSVTPDEYYDAAIIKHIMAAEEDEPCIAYDPRGFNSTKRTMPSAYCQHCRCPMRKCHNVLFGKYCQLHIVEVGQFCTYDAMTKSLVEEHFSTRYNEALQYVIFRATGLLDLKKYKFPECLTQEAFKQSVNYFSFQAYHLKMFGSITKGTKRNEDAHLSTYSYHKQTQKKTNSPTLSPDEFYDAAIVRYGAVNATTEDSHNVSWDPRGLASTVRALPSNYCRHCRCPKWKCHDVLFGLYCQLHIVELGRFSYVRMTERLVGDHFTDRYNEALQFVIFEETGLLDIKKYELPECLKKGGFQQSLNYSSFHSYHFKLFDSITEGQDRKEDVVPGRSHIYYEKGDV
jgi:hypothetical protein